MSPNVSSSGVAGSTGWDYEQDTQPGDPDPGETWFDTGNGAGYVYDGASWIETTPPDHSALSGVGADDHHPQAHDNADHTTAYLPESNYTPEADTHAQNHDNADHTTAYLPESNYTPEADTHSQKLPQGWEDKNSSRDGSTIYQNTTGGPIDVSVRIDVNDVTLGVGPNTSDLETVGTAGSGYNAYTTVPNGYYYKVYQSDTISGWMEQKYQ